MVALRVVTNSELKVVRRCMREHHLGYNLGYRTAHLAEALRVGTLLHYGLEAYWRAWQQWRTAPWLALAEAIDAMRPWVIDAFDLVRVETIMTGYHARWSDAYARDEFEVIGVEVEFRAPLINPATGAASRTYELGGKIDAIIRTRDGRIWIVEHKTTSEDIGTGSAYWMRLQLDAQVSMYYVGARSLGHDVVGCVYDVVGKPQLRPLKATPLESRKYRADGKLYANQRADDETPLLFALRLQEEIAGVYEHDKVTGELMLVRGGPDKYFQRGEVIRFESEETDAAFDTWQTTRIMREAEIAERYPRNPEACVRWGRTCEFFGVCTGSASLDDESEFRHVTQAHEELSAAIAGSEV